LNVQVRKYPSVFLPCTKSAPGKVDKTMCEVLWRNISDFYVNWSGETPTGNFSHAFFFFILDKNERPDWMTDLKHTDAC
jgi:hypothetical protein